MDIIDLPLVICAISKYEDKKNHGVFSFACSYSQTISKVIDWIRDWLERQRNPGMILLYKKNTFSATFTSVVGRYEEWEECCSIYASDSLVVHILFFFISNSPNFENSSFTLHFSVWNLESFDFINWMEMLLL